MKQKKHVKIQNEKDAILVFDLEGRVVGANLPVEQLSGHKPEDLIGRSLGDFLLKSEEGSRVLRAIRECVTQGCVAVEEGLFRHKHQKDFWAEMILVPLPAEKEAAKDCHCLLREITRQRDAIKTLREAHEMRAQFTATVSHELKTPLSVIKEAVAMLLTGVPGTVSAQQKHFLEIAEKNIERLEKLISETLDLKALEEGRKSLHIRENSMGEIFSEIEKMKKPVAEKKGLHLTVHADLGLPRINFDREQILECLGTLADFLVQKTVKGDIEVRAFRENNTLHAVIRSLSAEKPCADFSKLFLRFEPLNEEEKAKLGRTGVEFARAKEIIEKHRGKIWAEFSKAEGTCFHILLPIWEKRVRPEQ